MQCQDQSPQQPENGNVMLYFGGDAGAFVAFWQRYGVAMRTCQGS